MMINIQTILVTFLVRKKIFVKFYVSQMEVHGYTQTHKHTHTHIYTYIHIHTNIDMHVYPYIHTHILLFMKLV